ncbi:site-specific DNA-methyltransferase [Streptomyces sp. NPDC032161]|uniref:DNA-methyltransferase n=1 Tax=unclassified Streptomyces TaxID=2593676 RepID=UPI0033F3B119
MERVETVAEREAAAMDEGGPSDHMPLPPGRASVENGKLKDTPANRALHPQVTPQAHFTDSALVDRAYYSDQKAIVLRDDVRTGLRKLIDAGIKVDCIVTSPPYYGQRDYGYDGQLGLEERPQQFIDNLVEVFQLCWEVLSDTGSLWINIGDTYWSGKGAHKSGEAKQGARRFGIRPQDRPGDGKWARPKQLLLIPHRLAIALQDAGWLVRNDNVWVKPNPVPDQVRDRCSISHEYVFHLTKSRWYYFDRLPVGRKQEKTGRVLPPLDTWDARTASGNGGKHRAAFSDDLVRIPILATTPPQGIVLDPFNGSGTSMLFARSNGFRSIGIDLSEDYCEHVADELKKLDSQLDLES